MNPSRPSFSFALRTAIFALVCTMWSINAEAVEAVGKVQFVLGDVTAVNGGESRQLKKMDPIYESDTIETGPKGSTQLMMMDSARIAVRPNSAFIIAEYRLDDDNSASVLSVLKGGFRTLSGKIGEQAKENYRVETPTGIIGLRGTDHAVFHIPAGQEKFYGDGLAGTYSKVYEGSIILQNEDKILVITPATDAGYVAKDAAPKYVKTIPETAEGPVVVAPFDETESDEEAADESEVAAAPDEESASETESEAEAEIVVADELPAESGDAAAETQEIAPAPAPEPAPEPTSEIARAPNSGPINEIPAETIADVIQRETEESGNVALAEVDVFTFSVDATGREGENFQISGETTARTVRGGGQIQFRIIGANPNEFTMSPGVACDSGGLCTAMLPVGEREFVFTLTPLYDEQPDAENWRIVLVNDNPRIFVEDSVQLEWNIAIADAADVDVFTFSVDATGREGENFQISGETTARTVRGGGQIQFRIIGANPNEFTMSPGVACDSGGLCTAMLPVGEREFVFTLTPLYDEQPDAENWRIVLVNDNPRIFVEDSVQLEWNIAIADAADVDVFTFSVDATGREGENFQISGETTARTVRGGGQIQFRIIGANPNEFTMSPGVACDSGGLCTAMLPVGEREFVFTLTPLYDEQPDAENWEIVLVDDNPRIFVEDSVQLEWNIAIADAADVDVFTFSVDATGREEESFQIRVETARPVRREGQIRFRINGADRDEIGDLPTGVTYSTEDGVYSATLPAGQREFVFTLTPLYDEQPDAENWEIVLVDDNPRIFVEDSVQLEWNIAIADAADVDVFTFSVDATGREEESFQISGETTARTVRSGGQIQFRIIGANPNEFTMSPGVACDSGGLCTAMLPVGEREFVFTLTPLYDEQPDAENWRIVLVNDNPRIFVEDSVTLEWNIAIADIVAEVQIAHAVARTTFDEGESVQLRISSTQTSPADSGGLQVRFRINGADRNEIGDLPTGVTYSTEDGVYSATIPAGQREFTFNLITLTDSTDETTGEEWTVTLISDTGLYTGNSQVAFTVIDPQVTPPVDPPVDPPVTPSVPANFFGGGFETLTNPDESLNLAVPTDWIIGTGGILAIQDPDRMGAPATGIDIFPGGEVYNAIAAGDESYVRFASGQNVFYRMDSDGRFVNNAEGNAGRLSRQGEGGADYFTFSYALETGDRTFLTNYQVETRFLLNARKSDGINLNDAREFSEGATETWQFGTTTRTELNQRETFFPVTGTVENLQANLDYGRVPVPNPEGTDFVPGSFDYDISGQASFGTDNSKIFSRFDVQVTDAERCRGADTGCYDDRLVGKFEADANP